MLEREEGSETARERLGFGGEDFAQSGDLGVLLGDCHFAA
jgi:hypothetical protein